MLKMSIRTFALRRMKLAKSFRLRDNLRAFWMMRIDFELAMTRERSAHQVS